MGYRLRVAGCELGLGSLKYRVSDKNVRGYFCRGMTKNIYY